MGKDVISYMDFAENDYMFFKSAYPIGLKEAPWRRWGIIHQICKLFEEPEIVPERPDSDELKL